MAWIMKLSKGFDSTHDAIAFFEKVAKTTGEPTPLDDKPDLDEIDIMYYQHWQALHRSRQAGFSLNSLSISDIVAYSKAFTIYDFPRFLDIIQHIDGLFLRLHHDNSSSNKNS